MIDDGGWASAVLRGMRMARTDSGELEQAAEYHSYGMTLRDYFAAKALNGAMGASRNTAWGQIASADAHEWARLAYAFADAMLAERAKQSTER